MSNIMFLKKEYLLEGSWDEIMSDVYGFQVLDPNSDLDNTIPCKRISDGQYCCLPTWTLSTEAVNLIPEIISILNKRSLA
jgi:hypothetical protein